MAMKASRQKLSGKKISGDLDIKYPRLGTAVLLIVAGISFFVCVDAKRYLERLILPSVDGRLLKSFVETAIIMSYVVAIVIAYILLKLKFGALQLLGMVFGGIVLGIVSRIVSVFAGVLFPYR